MKYMVLGPGLRMSGPCVILLTLILLPLAYSDFVTLYVHREEPKIINENGPCSTVIEVDRDLAIADVLELVSKRLDAPIALLVEEGGARLPLSNVSIVADGTAWHALEAAHVENKTRCELAAAYRLFHMYGLAPFDGESINFIAARIPGSDMFLLNDYTLLWEEITASSLLRIPLYEAHRVGAEDGQPGHRNPRINEASIEGATAVFQNRSDVQCFLHSHTLDTSTVASLKEGLQPLSQAGIMLANMVANSHFDFYQDGPETVRLMAGKKIMLQKWHGMFVAGSSLGECFYLALSVDRAARAQRALIQTGKPYFEPTAEEVARWSRAYVDDPFYGGYDGERIWPAMVRKAMRLQPDLIM